MTIDKLLLCECAETATDLCEVLLRRTIAAYFARQTALPPHPLSVDVEVAFVLGAVALDARLRTENDGCIRHQNVPPSTTPCGATPNADQAAACVEDVNTAIPVAPPPRLILAALAVVAPVPPCAIETGIAIPCVAAFKTSVPSQYKIALALCVITNPVPPPDGAIVSVYAPVV